jgi:hypothetical protein
MKLTLLFIFILSTLSSFFSIAETKAENIEEESEENPGILSENPLREASYRQLHNYYQDPYAMDCLRYSKHLDGTLILNSSALELARDNCRFSVTRLNISWEFLVDPLIIERYETLREAENCRKQQHLFGKLAKNMKTNPCYTTHWKFD